MVDRLLRDFAALFEVRDTRTSLDRGTALLLAMIVIAGAVVRFWGLGAVGLHGDEKTMALPAIHLVEHGTALMPSGMFYPRAVGQLYLMAGSVLLFGQTEWALRLPSALCGVLLIVLAFSCGRRFLRPAWNLALTASVAFLPDFIEDAQTARMYVFLVASVAAFITLVFSWERTRRTGYLVAAVVAMFIGLQFHTLAIFAAFLVFVPGLLQGDRRQFLAGLVAFVAIVAGFFVIDAWISQAYPQSVASDASPTVEGPRAGFIPHAGTMWLALASLPAMIFAYLVLRRRNTQNVDGEVTGRDTLARLTPIAVATLLLAGALVAELDLRYHLAALLGLAGLALARRESKLAAVRVALFLIVGAGLLVAQAAYLHWNAAGSARQIAGLMLGWPSVWPLLSIAQNSPAAGLLAVAGLGWGLWRFAHRQSVPDYVLVLVLGAWLPLLMIGFMRWDIPPRYAEAQIMPLLIGALATAQWAVWRLQSVHPATVGAITATLACILVINPVGAAREIDSGYATHPDHKGAAEFIASVHPGPRDIVIAEDVLQQTYYLGHVDYWLVNKQVAAPFMHQVGGRWLDFYTNTPLIGTGRDLEHLIDRADRGAIYIIGSGENWEDGRTHMRAFGISQVLLSPPLKVVYRGRDGLTEVWKADAPQQRASAERGE